MENKYYVPDITEFYVGFEYEALDPVCDVWVKFTVNAEFENENPLWFPSVNKTRVKLLDKEDIESLGFEFGEYSKGRFKNETIELFNKFSTVWVIHAIGSDYRDKLFEGNIKNLSELKVLLKQLNIL